MTCQSLIPFFFIHLTVYSYHIIFLFHLSPLPSSKFCKCEFCVIRVAAKIGTKFLLPFQGPFNEIQNCVPLKQEVADNQASFFRDIKFFRNIKFFHNIKSVNFASFQLEM